MSLIPPALELRQLCKRFGATEVLRDVSLSVQPGERIGIIGPNGAGKSTLFNLISGRSAPSSGEVLLGGQRIDGMPPHRINRLGLARSFQITSIFPTLSVADNLRCGMLWQLGYRYGFWRSVRALGDVNQRVDALLALLELEDRRAVKAMDLSYAEQRALEIGITLAGGAQVILLDEPTAGMSQSESARFVGLIRQLTEGKTLLVVEHDLGVVFGLADKLAVLVQGELLTFDTPERVRANAQVQRAYLGPQA